MSLPIALLLFVLGLGLVLFFAELLVEATVGTAHGFGLSAFLISAVFIGFDPENLAVGAAGAYEGMAGIALGSILGAAMVALALALGITALIVPLHFQRVPRRILLVPVGAVLLLGGLSLDGLLSRLDGALLLAGYALAVAVLYRESRRGNDIQPAESVESVVEETHDWSRGKAVGLFVLSLMAIIGGSELLVMASETLIQQIGLSETVFGMTVLALVVSIEEVARELPAALKGRPDISFGNVVGSALAFFLFNAGLIALVRPVVVNPITRHFYLPMVVGTVLVTALLMLRNALPRWAGALLLALYVIFAAGGYLL